MSAAVFDTLDASLQGADVVVCCGSGGVGKTTTAAALGLQLASEGRRAVVVTIDPARRLADALGLPGGLTNQPAQLRLPDDVPGELWAMMLDTGATFDGLIRENASDAEQAERILANRFYRNIADALGGTQDYMAAERLLALHLDDRFDVVVVDTPPTRNALEFLDAPGTLSRFLDHPLFKLIMAPTRRGLKVLNIAAQPMLRAIGRVVGSDVLTDAIAFFQSFEGLEAGFRTRADAVMGVLRAPSTRYVLVASPKADTIEEARFFAGRLHASSLTVAALIINRSTPTFPAPTAKRPAKPSAADAVLWANLDELAAMALAERAHTEPLIAEIDGASSTWVPLLPDDVHDLDGLDRIRALLFDVTGGPRTGAR